MRIVNNGGRVSVEYLGKSVFSHSANEPFISAIIANYGYKSSHGNFKVKERIEKRIPLTLCQVEVVDETNADLNFSQKEINLSVKLKETENGLSFTFTPSDVTLGYEFKFSAVADEGIFGGGEQYRQLNMKGEIVKNFVSEHMVVPPIVQKVIFKGKLYKEKKHSYIDTYSPMSTFVSSEKYAVRFDAESYGAQDFTADNYSVFRYQKCPKSALFTVGESFKEISQRLNGDCLCKEYLPDWAYDGMILGVQGGIDRAEQMADVLTGAGAKVCGVWCQDWSGKKVTAAGKQVYWNWEVDQNLYPDLSNRIVGLKNKGVHFLGYINPYLVRDGKLYNFCKEQGFLIKNAEGGIYHVKSTTFEAGMMDLTNPDTVHYIQETLIKKNMLDLGIDGYMADFGEYLPVDCVLFNGDPSSLHNAWPTLWAKINREAVNSHPRAKEIFFFTRSGYNGCQKFTTMMWNGDQHTDFTKDYGMPCVMPATFNLGFSGVCAVHSDIGGFISFASLVRDKELFIRWMEMNAFSPLMRSHETIRPEANTQPYDKEILQYSAKLTNIHSGLKNYLKGCMEEAAKGIPVMRPDFYDANDFGLHKDLYSYLLGADIFVCPIIERGSTKRKVSLPAGKWKAFFTGADYAGGKDYVVDAPLGTPVAFYRAESAYADEFSRIK